MRSLPYNAVLLARTFLGTREAPGAVANLQILSWLRLDNSWPTDDAVPWCSAFANYVAKLLGLPRSRDLRARSWLRVGSPVPLAIAEEGFDVVVLARGEGPQPGPDVADAPGHVGFYCGHDAEVVRVLGGNQGDAVTIAEFPVERVLGVRRLA